MDLLILLFLETFPGYWSKKVLLNYVRMELGKKDKEQTVFSIIADNDPAFSEQNLKTIKNKLKQVMWLCRIFNKNVEIVYDHHVFVAPFPNRKVNGFGGGIHFPYRDLPCGSDLFPYAFCQHLSTDEYHLRMNNKLAAKGQVCEHRHAAWITDESMRLKLIQLLHYRLRRVQH